MRKDPTAFRQRFAAWKNGKLPYKGGRASEFDDTIEFIKPYEGFSDKVYLDGNGVPTIGYGFTDSALIAKGKMSRAEADILLRKELLNREAFLTKLKNWDKLSQGSKTALRSYYYNYPAGFKDTTKFMSYWNAGDYNNAIKEVNAGMNDKKNTGLRTRRLQEQALLRQDPFLARQVSPLVRQLEETPLFLPVQIQVPVDNIDFSLRNASLLSPAPRSINVWTGTDSPAYGGASLRMPSLQEYMLTNSIMPRYKDGKLPKFKDGTRYILNYAGDWDRITDGDVAKWMADMVVTPLGVRPRFDYENNPNYVAPRQKNEAFVPDNTLWTRQQIEKAKNARTWLSTAADVSHAVGEGAMIASSFATPEIDLLMLSPALKAAGNFAKRAAGFYDNIPYVSTNFYRGVNKAAIKDALKSGILQGFSMINPKNAIKRMSTVDKLITEVNASKITPAEWTAAQDAAIARGDMAEAQRLRDLHFKINTPGNVVVKQGTPAHNYHGTDSEFNTFDIGFFGRTDYGDRGKGFYFSENRNVSEDYGPIVKDVYLYAKTPYKGFGKEKYLGRGRSKDEVVQYLTEQHRKGLEDTIKHMINQQKSGSHSPMYDELGITKDMSEQEIRNLVNKAYNHEDVIPYEVGNLDEADVFLSPYENVVFKPNQIKSANAVTYDNNGVRIPLGERDNFKLNDIRYGLFPFISGGIGYRIYNKYAE